jgi:hypothetical protein
MFIAFFKDVVEIRVATLTESSQKITHLMLV